MHTPDQSLLDSPVKYQIDGMFHLFELSQFANTEIYARPEESVRGADCFVLQSHAPEINFHIMQQLILIDALKRASARRITAVVPFFGYSRADKKVLPREPISARLMGSAPTL